MHHAAEWIPADIPFDIVAAVHVPTMGIGVAGDMPWHLMEDMRRFKRLTTACSGARMNAVIMGRKTFDSLPHQRPLPHRFNIVITRHPSRLPVIDDTETMRFRVASSVAEAFHIVADEYERIGNVFVIGGGDIYQQTVRLPACRRLYLTAVYGSTTAVTHHFDAYFPELDPSTWQLEQCTPIRTWDALGGDKWHFQFWELCRRNNAT